MVAAPGATRIGALTNDAARQRFNVAASRARDQLWLFHTATLDVLSPACMRHHLLSYMLNPGRLVTEATGQKFDSQFERDIFGIVVAKGTTCVPRSVLETLPIIGIASIWWSRGCKGALRSSAMATNGMVRT